MNTLADFVKEKRNEVKRTQEAFADRTGVALTVIRKIEQGKENPKQEFVSIRRTYNGFTERVTVKA